MLLTSFPPEIVIKILSYLSNEDLMCISQQFDDQQFIELSQYILRLRLVTVRLDESSDFSSIQKLVQENCIERLRLENVCSTEWEDDYLTFVKVAYWMEITFGAQSNL